MSGENQPNTACGSSPGAALAAARAAQGLTIENISAKLKLTSFQIKAIEADDFSVLPGTVFARGYVRNYARLLNLDAEPLMLAMAPHGSRVSLPQDARLLRDATGVSLDKTAGFLPVAAVVVAGMVGALAYYEFVLNDAYRARSLPPVSSFTGNSAVATSEASAVLLLPPAAEPPALQDDSQGGANVAAITRRGLYFLFSQESWVEVRDGLGNVLFSKVNLPGTEHRVEGEPPFSVIVGRARGVNLAYDGNPIDLAAHATKDVARLRLE